MNNQPVTGFVGATQVTDSYTGGAQSLTLTTTATGGANSTVLFPLPSNSCRSGGNIRFTVSGQPEAVAISASISVSGGDSFGTVELVRDGMVIQTMTKDHNGTQGSISGGTLQPGQYFLSALARGAADNFNAGGFSYNVTISVTTTPAGEIHWINPSSGDFGVASNWSPQRVPMSIDIAIFDLTGSGPAPVPIRAMANSVGRWIIRHMGVGLIGSAHVVGTAADSFVVDDGGLLALNPGEGDTSFSTSGGAVVGDQIGNESRVLVGRSAKWFAGGSLVIGRRAFGKVMVDENALLTSEDSITLGSIFGTGGTLRVDGTLRVESGGSVVPPDLTLNSGSITVRGRSVSGPSSLKVGSVLDIGGQDGSGSVLIEDGGSIRAMKVLVGDRAGTGGETVTISGVDTTGVPSKLSADGELHVAGNAQTQIEVKDGGNLRTSGEALVGVNLAVGKVIVHGKSGSTPASWDALDHVFIGGKLTASVLIVEDGGIVNVPDSKEMVVGGKAGDIGRVSVSGGDTILNVGKLAVGGDGRGELTIAGANVNSRTCIVGGHSAEPPAGSGSGFVTIAAGPGFSKGTWRVTGDCAVGVDEPGTVALLGVKLGSVADANLAVQGSLFVGTQGRINGSGILTAPHVFNQGFISPGLSPGTIVIDGDYEQGPDGVLRIEAAGLQPGQFDVLQVTGNATLGGEIRIPFTGGYLPQAGDSFDFLEVGGTITGAFARMTFANLAPGFEADLGITADGTMRLTALTDAVPGGDCDSSGEVTVNEITTMVNVALGTGALSACETGDSSGDQQITIDEIIGAVNYALPGAPLSPSP